MVSIATNENLSGEKIEVVVKGAFTKTCRMRWPGRISSKIVWKYVSGVEQASTFFNKFQICLSRWSVSLRFLYV